MARARRIVLVAASVAGVLAVILVVFLFAGTKQYRMPAASMEPTLHCARPDPGCLADTADRVLAVRFALLGDAERGDIVAFETPPRAVERCGVGGTFVKRVLGLPGERIEGRDGRVHIDGRALDEPYLRLADNTANDFAPVVLEPDEYFLMGDNRLNSCDSREHGPVREDALVARVVARYWPPDRVGAVGSD